MAGFNNNYAGNNSNFSETTSVKGGIGGYYAAPYPKDQMDMRVKRRHVIPSAEICDFK